MTTYSVHCGSCGKEMLFEQPMPMEDPGELPAFCSDDCSRKFGMAMFKPYVDHGATVVNLPCGCFAAVMDTNGSGSTFPWMICDSARGGFENWATHSKEVHHQAIEITKQNDQ